MAETDGAPAVPARLHSPSSTQLSHAPTTVDALAAAIDAGTLSYHVVESAPWYSLYLRTERIEFAANGFRPWDLHQKIADVASADFAGDTARVGKLEVEELLVRWIEIRHNRASGALKDLLVMLTQEIDKIREFLDRKAVYLLPKPEQDGVTHWEAATRRTQWQETATCFLQELDDLTQPLVRSAGWERFRERCKRFGYTLYDPRTLRALGEYALTVAPPGVTWFNLTLTRALDLADALDDATPAKTTESTRPSAADPSSTDEPADEEDTAAVDPPEPSTSGALPLANLGACDPPWPTQSLAVKWAEVSDYRIDNSKVSKAFRGDKAPFARQLSTGPGRKVWLVEPNGFWAWVVSNCQKLRAP